MSAAKREIEDCIKLAGGNPANKTKKGKPLLGLVGRHVAGPNPLSGATQTVLVKSPIWASSARLKAGRAVQRSM